MNGGLYYFAITEVNTAIEDTVEYCKANYHYLIILEKAISVRTNEIVPTEGLAGW